MNFNLESINEFVKEEFNGSKKAFAEELKLNRPTVSQILNNSMDPTKSFITHFYSYCKDRRLDFDSFILD